MYLHFFFQNKDDVEQRDTGAFRPVNRRWNCKQTGLFFFNKYYNKKKFTRVSLSSNVGSMNWPM